MAEELREARQRRGLSQAKVAAEIGVDVKTIQRLEDGAASPRVDTLSALADLYGRSLDSLAGRSVAPDRGAPDIEGDREAAVVLSGAVDYASAYALQPSTDGASVHVVDPDGNYVATVPLAALHAPTPLVIDEAGSHSPARRSLQDQVDDLRNELADQLDRFAGAMELIAHHLALPADEAERLRNVLRSRAS